jgi:predicted AlkP superfamily pyrophosphatase or phosphodiesterase
VTKVLSALLATALALTSQLADAAKTSPAAAKNSASSQRASLVLQITVDQLRGDMLAKYYDRFGKGGFKRLIDHGAYYINANYGTANTLTCPGHAVLVTGADTAQHGIPANDWYDRDNHKPLYCVSDPKTTIVGATEGAGMSPVHLTSTTIGDELVLSFFNSQPSAKSRSFAVAGKDRSSIIPGGHLGKAYWYSEESGAFVTSSYYMKELPAWAIQWNKARPIEKYRPLEWTPARELSTYHSFHLPLSTLNPHARPNKTLGNTFPHSFLRTRETNSDNADQDKDFYSMVRFTPMLDEYTYNFARALITNEKIGQGAPTDYLSISFSSTDYVGHTYGPNSIEYEDNLIRLDTLLADLFTYLDKQIGPNKTLIILSADHGADDIPEDRATARLDADRMPSRKPIVAAANAYLQAHFNTTENLVADYIPPGLYLDDDALKGAGVGGSGGIGTVPGRHTIENALADYALKYIPGAAYAITRTDLIRGNLTNTELNRRIQRAFHPDRSGDVTLIQKQFWYMDSDKERYAATHGSPYSYDTYVPVIFYGPGIRARHIARNVEPASIAPTIAAILRIRPPSGATAPILPEILD